MCIREFVYDNSLLTVVIRLMIVNEKKQERFIRPEIGRPSFL